PEKPLKFEDHLFSEKFACPNCNVSLPEIEPRIFSFNSPHGACPTCTGLGILLKIDPGLVINPNLTISEGGILPFAKFILNDTWYGRILTKAIREIGFAPDRPLKEMTEIQKKAILYGTGDQIFDVSGKNRHGNIVTIHETFNGVITELEKRYLETESDYVRNEIGKYLKEEICPSCLGKRLKKEALSINLSGLTIVDLTSLSIESLSSWIKDLRPKLSEREKTISELIIREIYNRLNFLLSVGLDYLTLDRSAASLAGGEAQRIRLASQIGSGLSGVLYILDEPSIGLHPRDNQKLIETLKNLRDLGNTVIVVEHDKEMMANADLLVDFGPGAGEHGGKIIAQGTYEEICRNPNSQTGEYLSGKKTIANLQKKSPSSAHQLTISGCRENNLKNIKAVFPLSNFITVTGVSGSGKSTLVVDTLYPAVAAHFNPYFRQKTGKFASISGLEYLNRTIIIDQSPIGRTPRSNPATYTGAFSYIRELFSQTPQAKARGYQPGRFSFNVKGGRCEACEGEGQTRIEMQFLPDVYVTCDVCGGTRFNRETLEVRFKNKNIAEILQMTVEEALYFFENIPGLSGKFQTLYDVGLSYIHLGQPAPHLSGGEAQRVKLASELSKKNTRSTLFLLDEPTTGLHFADLEKLLAVLRHLVDMGNTVIVIEHNPDIIKNSDWIIDLGPEGGDNGGEIIATGTPKEIAASQNSYTGKYLKKILK
ncbi:excinuclease ABC subunit UvrA, partial [Candidatus Microgenomates bacterium]|nr:excinuclease ABC subunit UvrA [Candidatus Microgenomates bacterium]